MSHDQTPPLRVISLDQYLQGAPGSVQLPELKIKPVSHTLTLNSPAPDNVLIYHAQNGKEVIRLDSEGRLFWHGLEVIGPTAFQQAMLAFAGYLTGSTPRAFSLQAESFETLAGTVLAVREMQPALQAADLLSPKVLALFAEVELRKINGAFIKE